jgi:hypothetical protein
MASIIDCKKSGVEYNPGSLSKQQEMEHSAKALEDKKVSELAIRHFDQNDKTYDQGAAPYDSSNKLWERLPVELQLHILSFLPACSLFQLEAVSKNFRALLTADNLWRRHLYKPLPEKGQSKAAVLRNLRLMHQKPISTSSFTVEPPSMYLRWLLNDIFFMLINTSTLVCFHLKTNKQQEFKFPGYPVSLLVQPSSDQCILLPELDRSYGQVVTISPEGEVSVELYNYNEIIGDDSVQKVCQYAPRDVFANITNEFEEVDLVEFQFQSDKKPIKYDKPCKAINSQTGENFDYYPELTGLQEANNLYLIFKPFGNFSWPSVLVSRETKKQIDLPKEIAEGNFVEMTQRAIYVVNENKLMCYDLCSKKTHTLNDQLPVQKVQIHIQEFEDKIIVYYDTQLYLYNSDYKKTWNIKFSLPITRITPTAEFLAVQWHNSHDSIGFLDWDSGNPLHDKPIADVFHFADNYLVKSKSISKESFEFDIHTY